MNHLAHQLLAARDDGEPVGALIADYLRGAIPAELPGRVRLGVRLHRRIDAYTDSHAVALRSRRRLRETLRRYAGLVVDLAYDHYLIRHWPRFSDEPLARFRPRVYSVLAAARGAMPATLRERLPLMLADDFLYRSARLEDLRGSLQRLGERLSRRPDLTPAIEDLRRCDRALEEDFLEFFPQLQGFVEAERRRLLAAGFLGPELAD